MAKSSNKWLERYTDGGLYIPLEGTSYVVRQQISKPRTYEDGGLGDGDDPKKPKPVIYTDYNKYLKAKQAYGDSLNLHKAYVMQKKLMNYNNKTSNISDKNITKEERLNSLKSFNIKTLKENRKEKIVPGLEEIGPITKDYKNEKEMFHDTDPNKLSIKNNKKLINYYKSLGFTDNNIMYHFSPDVVHPNIKPIDIYHDTQAWSPVYQEPITKPEYKNPNNQSFMFPGVLSYDKKEMTPFNEEEDLNFSNYTETINNLKENKSEIKKSNTQIKNNNSNTFKNKIKKLKREFFPGYRLPYQYQSAKVPFFEDGGKYLTVNGEYHRIYENAEGDIMVNHPKEDKGKWDTINLTQKAKAKTIAQGIAATKKWHKENPQYANGGWLNQYEQGGYPDDTAVLDAQGQEVNTMQFALPTVPTFNLGNGDGDGDDPKAKKKPKPKDKKTDTRTIGQKRHDALEDAKAKILKTESPENRKKMDMLYSTTIAAENTYGYDSRAYGRKKQTRSPMSIDNIALDELFNPKGQNNRYTLQQKLNFDMLRGLGLPTDRAKLKELLETDDAYAGLGTAKTLYFNEGVLGNLPNPTDTTAYINLYLNEYNKKGALKHQEKNELVNNITNKMRGENNRKTKTIKPTIKNKTTKPATKNKTTK